MNMNWEQKSSNWTKRMNDQGKKMIHRSREEEELYQVHGNYDTFHVPRGAAGFAEMNRANLVYSELDIEPCTKRITNKRVLVRETLIYLLFLTYFCSY